MNTFRASIPGSPVAKGRPRIAVVNGHARAYTPRATAEWESRAVSYLRQSWGSRAPLPCPVAVHVVAVFERPSRLTTKRLAASMDLPHVTKPDGSNVLKSAEDALEKAGVFANDSQVWDSRVTKRYANNGEQPAVHVLVTWAAIEQESAQ